MTHEDCEVAVKGMPTDGRNNSGGGRPDVARRTADTGQWIIEVAVTGSPNTVMNLHFDVRSTHLHSPLLGFLLALHVPVNEQKENKEWLPVGQGAASEMTK